MSDDRPVVALEPTTLAVLAATPSTLRALLTGIPSTRVSSPGVEGWSPLDVIAHLLSIDEPILAGRVQLLVNEEHPDVPNVGEEMADISGMRTWPIERLLDEFASRRAEHVASLEVLTAEQLGRRGRHALAGDISVADAIHHIAYHDLVHIQQISELLLAPIEQSRGAMRGAFPHKPG